jgi:FkbM family methyltransferase
MLATLRFILSHPANRGARTAALVRYLEWQIRSRLLRRRIVYPWIGDVRFFASTGETGLTGNIYCGLHEFPEMAFVLHALGPGQLFVDVGANAGSYTLLAAGVSGASCVAIEPVPATFARLVANVRLNKLEERVRCLNIGLADVSGELAFVVDEDTVNRVATGGERPGSLATVSVRTLDEVLGGERPSVLKVDVEGYELAVLRGGSRCLADPVLHSLIVETNGSGNRYGFGDGPLFELLRNHGFTPFRYDPLARRLSAWEADASANTIFVRDIDRVAATLAAAMKVAVNALAV